MSLSQARLNYISIILIALFSASITFYGFFLTTTKLSDTTSQNLLTNTTDSWFQPKTKVVMLMIDALRFDYFQYDESIAGQEKYPYQNRFKKVHQLFKDNPENFVTIRTYADPPTWTVQRIRCLATGNIPPFIRVAQSLSAAEVEEDNIFRQAKNSGKQSYAIGDPLWPELFRDTIIDGFRSQSFNLLDLESEKIVAKITLDAVKKNEYDLVVGHRLGADHVGHFFDTNLDPRIGEQLDQNDDLAIDIINSMDDNTILIILGDHGQGADGSHGGATDEETSTVVAAYCKNGFRKYKNPNLSPIMNSLVEKPTTSMMQVDIAPTLSMLMGMPIPFSNLGQIINDFYPNIPGDSDSSFEAQLLRDNYLNTLQIHNYLVTYQERTQFFKGGDLASLNDMFKEIQDDYQRVSNMDHKTQEFQDQTVQLILKMQSFSENTYQIAKTTSFYDGFLIVVGILITILTLAAHILLSIRLNISQNEVEISQNQQDWTLKKSLKETLTNKFLYCVLLSAVLVGVAFRPTITYVVSGAILALVTKAVGILGIDVYRLYKRAYSDDAKVPSPVRINIELGSVFLSEDQERGIGDKSHQQTQSHISARAHKILSSLFRNSRGQMALALFAMFSIIIAANLWKPGWALLFMNDDVIHGCPLTSIALTLLYFTVKYVTKIGRQALAIVLIISFCVTARILRPNVNWWTIQTQIAMLLFGYFVYSRVKRLRCSNHRISLKHLHLATFCGLWVYFTFKLTYTLFVDVYVPRIIYGLILASSIGGCILARRSISQNLQLCLIELLCLMQQQDVILSFALLLCMLRFTNFFFKKLNYGSYAYPIWVAAQSYLGFFMTSHTDRLLGTIKFAQGFVGLEDYNAVLSPAMIFLNTYASFIVGMTFMVNYRQNIRIKKGGFIMQVDEEDTFEEVEERSSQTVDQSAHSQRAINHVDSSIDQGYEDERLKLLKVRNNIIFVLFFSVAYTIAMVRCYFVRDIFLRLAEGNETLIMDGSMYFLTLFIGVPLIF